MAATAGGVGHRTELLCGAYSFDGSLWPALLAGLPAVTVVGSAGDRALSTLLALLAKSTSATIATAFKREVGIAPGRYRSRRAG